MSDTTTQSHAPLGTFPNDDVRKIYAATMAQDLEAAGKLLLSMARDIKENPDHLLGETFSPNISGMHPGATSVIEVMMLNDGCAWGAEVRARAPVGRRTNEIAFRVMCGRDGTMRVAGENRF
jgi:hypothetical protein